MRTASDGDPSGADGMERGTHHWDAQTSALTVTHVVDTNSELGLSHPDLAFQAQLLGPRSIILADKESTFLSRTSNTAVLPDWRLNKGRNYRQTQDNTVQGAQSFWDLWGRVQARNPNDATSVTIRGGRISGSRSFDLEDTGWTVEQDYASEALLDAEFPSNTTYTLTLRGGELGTVNQEITIGSSAYPNIPFLTGSHFTDAQSIDSTSDLTLEWTNPGSLTTANGSTNLQIFLNGFDETEFFEVNRGGAHTSATLPAQTFEPGQSYFGLAETSNALDQNGISSFGISGFSSHLSFAEFTMATLDTVGLVQNFAEKAGLAGAAANPLAMPFGEGINNLLKYAFNMDASGADTSILAPGTGTSGLPAFELEPTTGVFQLEFVRRKGAGLVYTPKCSTSLDSSSFLPIVGTVTVTEIDSNFERVVVSDTCYPATTPWWFGFVEVVAP